MRSIDAYIEKLLQTDDELQVIADPGLCEGYVTKNYSRVRTCAPKAIIYPVLAGQIGEIIRLANEYKVPLVVRSSQGEMSYNGSSVPAEGTEAVAVNLSKMTKIMHIDTKNGIVLIESGVTYRQLNEALKPYGFYVEHPLMPRPEKSVIASLLDRDPVMTPKHCWDIPDPLTCVELYMGNGDVFRTGSAAGPGTLEEMLKSGCALNQPQGPYCLDLSRVISGSQGTLSIVTWASVKIRPIGSVKRLITVQSDDLDALAGYTGQIIRRRLGENIIILNNAAFRQITGMDATVKKWILLADVRGNRYFPERFVENQIADMSDLADEFCLKPEDGIAGFDPDTLRAVLENTSEADDYWKDRKGDIRVDQFFLSTLDKTSVFVQAAEDIIEKHGISRDDLAVYLQPVMMGRSCHIEFLVPSKEDEIDQLEKDLGTAMLGKDAFFSRPYGALTAAVYEKSVSQTPFMKHIKYFFDENNIMNPDKLVYDGGN